MKKNMISICRRIVAVVLIAVLLLDNNTAVMAETISDAFEKRMEEAEAEREYNQKIDDVMSQVIPDEEPVSEPSAVHDESEADQDEPEAVPDDTKTTGEEVPDEDTPSCVSLRLPEPLLDSANQETGDGIYGELVSEDEYSKTYKKDATHFVTVIHSTKKTFTDENGDEKEYDLSLVPTDMESGSEVEQPTAEQIRDENLNIVYNPRETDVNVTLPANVTEGMGITVENNGNSIEVFPLEGDYGNATIKAHCLL